MESSILSRAGPSNGQRLCYGPEALHFGDLRLPVGQKSCPVVVVVHGGFWRARYDLQHTGHLCAALTNAGMATWNIEYRRVGSAGGGWPNTFLDVSMATDHLRALASMFPLDLDRIVLLGHSAGAHLALWLAARHRIGRERLLFQPDPVPVCGTVALAGMPDLSQAWELGLGNGIVETFLGGTPADCGDRYLAASPSTFVPLGSRQVLIHGRDDTTVPLVTSEQYARRAHEAGDEVSLKILPDTGHFELIDPRSPQWLSVQESVVQLQSS
ncbi:MAG: alpha/beta hydrolase [Chloroflexota bacterium]